VKELIAIQSELKANKSQYNKFGKYNYRSAEDILEALKPHLLKHECTCVITEDVRCVGAYTYIHTEAVITNKDGQTMTATGTAGIEKAGGMALPQAFGSASSYAKKYALGNLFLLDDTKDADATNNHQKKTVARKTATPVNCDSALKALHACTDLAGLKSTWDKLSPQCKTDERVLAMKESKKKELS
jgi:hypothetical protein